MLESKNTDDSIDESDDEDQDSCGVVKDVSSFLILLDIDIKATENQEQCPSYCLKQNILLSLFNPSSCKERLKKWNHYFVMFLYPSFSVFVLQIQLILNPW